MPLPPFTESGDLPLGVHRASFHEVGERFGAGTLQRSRVFLRLERLYSLARATGHLARMIVFGSFVTTKSEAGRATQRRRRDRPGGIMIATDQELHAMLERIRHFQGQVAHLRIAEANPTNFRLSVSGLLAEIDRMQLEVREYLSLHPTDSTVAR